MQLDEQLEVLIKDAANHGVSPAVIEQAIVPVLKSYANQLQHLEYYVLQNIEQNWVLTTITNPQLRQNKKVIYAFKSVRDAANFQSKTKPDLIAMPIPVAQLLFRLFSLQQVDSVIFLENSHNLNQGIEIKRQHLSKLIGEQIEQLKKNPPYIA